MSDDNNHPTFEHSKLTVSAQFYFDIYFKKYTKIDFL